MGTSKRNIKHVKSKVALHANDKGNSFRPLRELLGLISTGAGIFVALLYLAGRSYASGYFDSMNIREYIVNFSLWEYGAVAWTPILLYPSGMMAISGFFWGVVYTIFGWIQMPINRFFDWLKSKIKFRASQWNLPNISSSARRWFIIGLNGLFVFIVILTVIFTLQFVEAWGKLNGQLAVLESASIVELASLSPLPLDNGSKLTSQLGGQSDQYYIYEGYRLLTFNNGKYYLFREIDSSTCKPVKVYIVGTGQGLQVNLSAAESLKDQCANNIKNPGNISPTILSTPDP